MSGIPHLVGMIHLQPLPGSPRYAGSMHPVIEAAVSDATTLASAGFPALMVENFGDAPFHADQVEPATVAAITAALLAVVAESGLPVGVNVLRNDASAALGIASATGAAMIRVNVLTGTMFTDQGPIVGRAAEVLRQRAAIAPGVEIWADVMVKHATAPPGMDAAQAALDTVERGLADALIVSGSGTGVEPTRSEVEAVRGAVPKGTRLVIGSGASVSNLASLAEAADTVIVGSSLKVDNDPSHRVDIALASAFVEAASRAGLL